MIVVDTNVLSEPMRPHGNERVLRWLAAQTAIAVTSITVGELWDGVRRLPAGRRRDGLTEVVEKTLMSGTRPVLAYDERAAREYALLREECRSKGRGLSVEDGMIAAIVRSTGNRLATRNVRDFAGLGIVLVNPWTADDS